MKPVAPLLVGLASLFVGCGPTYMGPPPNLQAPPGYPRSTMPTQPTFQQQPTVPPDGSTARTFQQIPEVSPDEVFIPPRSAATTTYHRVGPGDSVASLARKFGVTAEQLRKANAWSTDPDLKPGDMVQIPR